MFLSRFMPCPECGDSVDRRADWNHRCDRDRLVDYRMFELRHHVAGFETQLHSFLATSRGRFEMWLAARDVAGQEGS